MSYTLSFSACQQRDKSQKLDFHDVKWVNYQVDNDNGYFKGAQSRFAHIEKISFNFSNSSFVIRVNLLHP